MNYFATNLKRLREENQLSQEEFGALFELSRANIKSYESGNYPKIGTFIKIMDHFSLDPSKFLNLDMEKYSVRRNEKDVPEDRGQIHDIFFEKSLSKDQEFNYLDDYDDRRLKELLKSALIAKEVLLKENMQLKEKNIEIFEKYVKLLEGSDKKD